jgi:hypothetical protein
MSTKKSVKISKDKKKSVKNLLPGCGMAIPSKA